MTHSLNETEALCRKAARGAGYAWGLADEAGRAARWLEARGLLGLQALAGVLEECEGSDLAQMTPRIGEVWRADGPLCPITTGAALADHAHLLDAGPVRLGQMRHPMLLLPFVAAALRADGQASVTWPGAQIAVVPEGVAVQGMLGASDVSGVSVVLADATPLAPLTRRTRCNIPDDLYTRLNTFAARTYAPATEASRLAGAGAGLTDND